MGSRSSRSSLQRWFGKAVGAVVFLADRMVSKDCRRFLIVTPEVNDDQAIATFVAFKSVGMRIAWATAEPSPVRRIGMPQHTLGKQTPIGLWELLRSGTVLHTHGLGIVGDVLSRRRNYINLWHGMPIKVLPPGGSLPHRLSQITIATSPKHVVSLAEAFAIDESQIRFCGLPRNDVLVKPRSLGRQADSTEEQLSLTRKPLIVWLPTFRTNKRFGGVDGADSGNPFQMGDATYERVDAMARELDANIVLKVHRNANGVGAAPPRLDSLHVWDNASLLGAGMSLYELLAQADVLVTDYSSVWIDFLLTQKPIVFAVEDVEDYAATRGLLIGPDEFPGEKVTSFAEMASALGRALQTPDLFAPERMRALAEHHVVRDGTSSDRVVELAATLNHCPQ
jgi:CDP-glycerol glycerophosphotransferase (TagB/SpsB family)